MSARQEVNQLLGQWLQLTQAEAVAIQSAAWPKVGDIQSVKTSLQESLTAAIKKWTFENGRVELPAGHPFQTEVNRLVSLESRNAELLSEQIRRAGTEKESQSEGLRNLRRLRRSYVQKRANGWESYS